MMFVNADATDETINRALFTRMVEFVELHADLICSELDRIFSSQKQ